jgi:hypothetical protein
LLNNHLQIIFHGVYFYIIAQLCVKRHEILFEDDYLTTWQHMFEWIKKQILKKNKVSE